MNRKRFLIYFTLSIIGLFSLGLLSHASLDIVPQVQAQEVPENGKHRPCSNGTVKGRFGALLTGHFLPGNPLGVPAGTPISLRGIYVFDGNGGGRQEELIAIAGGNVIPVDSLKHTYEVKADCTWKNEAENPFIPPGTTAPGRGVIVNNGKEIMMNWVVPGVFEGTGILKRIDAKSGGGHSRRLDDLESSVEQ